MVIGAFPVAKLAVLAIKQISKPIANVIKAEAKEKPFFRKYVCMPPAQFYNWMEVKTKMWALNLGKNVTVPKLNEAMAIELGANLLGEFIIFAIGAGILIFEYSRQTNKEYRKEEAMRAEKMELQNTLNELSFRLERQDTQIREMTRALADMDSRNIFRWSRERIQEFMPFDPNNPDQSVQHAAPNDYSNPNAGVVFKALNFLDQQVFVNKSNKKQIQQLPTSSEYIFKESGENYGRLSSAQ